MALQDEGNDPETYVFQIDNKNSTPVKQGPKKKENSEEEMEVDEKENSNDKEEVSEKEVLEKEASIKEEAEKDEPKTDEPAAEFKESEDDTNKTLETKKEESSETKPIAEERKEIDEVKEENKEGDTITTAVTDQIEEPKKDEGSPEKVVEEKKEEEPQPESIPQNTDENKEPEEKEEKKLEDQLEETALEKDVVDEEYKDMKDDEDELEDDPKDYEEGEELEEIDDADHHEDEDSKTEEKNENDMNGVDNEDSINLTLGEEDEKLMAGEVDLLTKDGKDLKERGVSRLSSSKKAGSAQDLQRKSDPRNSSPEKAADDKVKKSNYRNLWVSGLSSITRATDLKHVFSKLGKVVAAKVVTNAKTPGARCYGFVTMATSEDAQKCIKGLNLTELHGRLISVEAVANRPTSGARKPTVEDRRKSEERRRVDDRRRSAERRRVEDDRRRHDSRKREEKRKIELSPVSPEEKRRKRAGSEILVPPGTEDMVDENGDGMDTDKLVVMDSADLATGGDGGESDAGRSRSSRGKSREDRRRRSTSLSSRRSQHQGGSRPGGVLSFSQIKEERERARARERERAAREEERRRRERHRAIERKQRDESLRLEREREKIRFERERLERERTELLRLERERLEREKEDLKRQQLKLEEARRNKRTLSSARDGYDDRKRVASESSRRYDPVHLSPTRPDYKKESRRDISPPGRSRYDEPPRSSRRDEPTRVKDRGYSDRPGAGGNSGSFRREDRDRREDSHRMKTEGGRGHRDNPSSKGERYGAEAWSTGVSKGFGAVPAGNGREQWSMGQDRKPEISPWARPPAQSERFRSRKEMARKVLEEIADSIASPPRNSAPAEKFSTSLRWVSNSSMMVSGRSGPGHLYPPGITPVPSSMGMPMSSGYQQGDRFDAYKPMGSAPRKY